MVDKHAEAEWIDPPQGGVLQELYEYQKELINKIASCAGKIIISNPKQCGKSLMTRELLKSERKAR